MVLLGYGSTALRLRVLVDWFFQWKLTSPNTLGLHSGIFLVACLSLVSHACCWHWLYLCSFIFPMFPTLRCLACLYQRWVACAGGDGFRGTLWKSQGTKLADKVWIRPSHARLWNLARHTNSIRLLLSVVVFSRVAPLDFWISQGIDSFTTEQNL